MGSLVNAAAGQGGRGISLRGRGQRSRFLRGLGRGRGRQPGAVPPHCRNRRKRSHSSRLHSTRDGTLHLHSPNMSSSISTTGRRYSLWHFGSQAWLAAQAFSQQAGLHSKPLQQRPSRSSLRTAHFAARRLRTATASLLAAGGLRTATASLLTASRLRTAAASLPQQAGSGQQPLAASQHLVSQQQPLASNISFTSANKSRTGSLGRQQSCSVSQQPQAFSQQAGFAQQAQAFAQQPQAFSQQAGSGQQAFGQAFSQQATLAQALHSPQPPPVQPNMRSKSSKPNPWLHRATLTRSAPIIVLPFIEQQLLYSELGWETWVAYPQFIRCTAPGPSSQSLARFHPIRLPDAPSSVPPRHAQLLRVSPWYRPRRKWRLSERNVFPAKGLLLLLAKISSLRKAVKVCRLYA